MLNAKVLKKQYQLQKQEKKLESIKKFEIENQKLIDIWDFEMKKGINKLEKFTTITVLPEMVMDSYRYLQNIGFLVGIPNNYLTQGNLYVYWEF